MKDWTRRQWTIWSVALHWQCLFLFNTEESSACANSLVVGMRGLLSEFGFPAAFAPFGVKLEVNQAHQEFSVPMFGVVSVTFGVSEQAALSSSLYKCLWISRCCSQLLRGASLCCAPSLLQLQTQKIGNLHPALDMQLLSCSFSMAHPNQATLPKTHVKNKNWEKIHPCQCHWEEFWGPSISKKALSLGKCTRTTPRTEIWCRTGVSTQQFCFVWVVNVWECTRLPPTNILGEGSSVELCLGSAPQRQSRCQHRPGLQHSSAGTESGKSFLKPIF